MLAIVLLIVLLLLLPRFLAKGNKEPSLSTKMTNCRISTKDNPFANYTMYDQERDACALDEEVVRVNYFDGLLIDSTDLFMQKTGFNKFVTTPSTRYPNVRNPKEWYPDTKECKNTNTSCIHFTDIRYHRPLGEIYLEGNATLHQ